MLIISVQSFRAAFYKISGMFQNTSCETALSMRRKAERRNLIS